MVYINNLYDVTLTPPGDQMIQAFQQSRAAATSADECIQRNLAVEGNGAPCIRQLCSCMGGVAGQFGCPNLSTEDMNKIQNFCGGYGTSGFYNNGAFWYRTPEAQVLDAPRTYTGPTPGAYGVGGMYQPLFQDTSPHYDQ